ncbi:helix-turn-helix domain-containing protein [Streptomyces sviceus]|uniref:winged helix-turn-helix domain-containing protein n=1 Tax=Streptomyces sviceus TaxID=285530 RepID=UPI0038111115
MGNDPTLCEVVAGYPGRPRYLAIMLTARGRRGGPYGAELAFAIREFDLLEFTQRNPGRATSRAELIQQVWGWQFGDLPKVIGGGAQRSGRPPLRGPPAPDG